MAAKSLVQLREGPRGIRATAPLTERELEKFHKECALMAGAVHPNIVQVGGCAAGCWVNA